MSYTLWSQDIFSKGELSPYMYSRATVNEYNNGLKTAQNVLTYPTGAAGKRFGTLFQSILSTDIASYNQIYFQTWQYLNEAVYQLVFYPNNINIFLEGIFQFAVTTTLDASDVFNLSTTTIGNVFRVTGVGFPPYDLTRIPQTAINITGLVSGQLSISPNLVAPIGTPFPTQFITTGTLPTTNPQIKAGVTYFIASTTSNTAFSIYSSAYNAKFNINPFAVTALGSSSQIVVLNQFVWAPTTFKNLPIYDFNGLTTSYDGITFTPTAATGSTTVTLDSAYSKLNSSYIGGAFIGGGGSGRITAVADTTHFTISVEEPFQAGVGIIGSLALLAEPAWSTARGWPQVCSSYQNRALFANTESLSNGFWASVINDYADFGDLTTDDDDAISWFPSSDDVNYIRFIVPYRSITVHTNTGIYSSPLSDIAAITPSNFTLQLQDSTPADVLQPQSIDNQILVLSGNDAHQMLWDGINNAYTSNVVSVINEQTIRSPQDETAFRPLNRAGSRFVFIINLDGSMAVFQTLLSQGVSGFAPQIMEQSYGDASFLQAASSAEGRCWFVVQRELALALSAIAITGFSPYSSGPPIVNSTLLATSSNFSTTSPTAISFTTTGALPTSSPQITITQYYWAIGIDANNFEVYLTQEDAINNIDAIKFTNAGTSSNVVPTPLQTYFTLEELTNDVFLDCAVQYNGTPTDTITSGLFNAQDIKMIGDGFGFDASAENNINNLIVFQAHGQTMQVSNAYLGFPINTIIEPMPLSISNGASAKETTLTKPKRVEWVRFMFNNTIGGTINGVPIALESFNMADIGEPPQPARGIFEMSIFKAWDDFNNPTYTIEHNEPFDIQLLGVFYSVEI